MFRPDGLSVEEYELYLAGLVRTHERSIEVTVTDLEGRNPVTLAPLILSGQVTVDIEGNPSRVLTLEFLDPTRALMFDTTHTETPLHRSRMIRVTDRRLIPALGRWVDCPVFVGPIYDYDRDGVVVSITAHGKEAQAMGAQWTSRVWKPKRQLSMIVKQILRGTGERDLAIPNLKRRIRHKVVLRPNDKPWKAARKLASSADRHLFYDARGFARMRRQPQQVVHTFDRDWLVSEITPDRDPEGVFNVFTARGKKPAGKGRSRPSATVWLWKDHPNSAPSLGRNGEPLRLARTVTNNQLKNKRDCRRRAERMRDNAALRSVSASADVLPLPNLDEGDLVMLSDGGQVHKIRMNKWSYPLTGEGMAVGSVRRVGTRGGRHETGPRPLAGVAVSPEDVYGEESE